MSDILRQIDEDLRKERIIQLLKSYGIYIIVTIVVIIVSIISYQLVISKNKSENERLVEIYIQAESIKNSNQKLEKFSELINAQNEYLSGLAELKVANFYINNDNIEKALESLDNIIDNQKYDPIINDLSLYFMLMIKLEKISYEEFSSYIDDEMIEISKFKYLFKELIAIKNFLNGNADDARKRFQNLISDPDIPLEINTRAIKFIELIK
tara:strand:+ start:777 stop:1409 length:633 start_codon:yes stop_codon:yes gene_type:complete